MQSLLTVMLTSALDVERRMVRPSNCRGLGAWQPLVSQKGCVHQCIYSMVLGGKFVGKEVEHWVLFTYCVCACARTWWSGLIRDHSCPQESFPFASRGQKEEAQEGYCKSAALFLYSNISKDAAALGVWGWGIGLPISTLFLESTAKW